jgi:hypothetical protein
MLMRPSLARQMCRMTVVLATDFEPLASQQCGFEFRKRLVFILVYRMFSCYLGARKFVRVFFSCYHQDKSLKRQMASLKVISTFVLIMPRNEI